MPCDRDARGRRRGLSPFVILLVLDHHGIQLRALLPIPRSRSLTPCRQPTARVRVFEPISSRMAHVLDIEKLRLVACRDDDAQY